MTTEKLDWTAFGANAAEIYERVMVPAFFAAWAADLATLARLGVGERVLDVACGTGVVAREAARRVGPTGTVTGLDLTPAMLTAARVAAAGLSIEWRDGRADALPFPDGAFDVVLCQQGLQFFPDRHDALAEMRRVLVARGRLGLAVFCSSGGHAALVPALAPYLGEASKTMMEPFSLPDGEALLSLVGGAGFSDVSLSRAVRPARFPSTDAFLGFLLAGRIAPLVSGLAPEARSSLARDAAAALRPFADGDGLAFDMESHLLTARA